MPSQCLVQLVTRRRFSRHVKPSDICASSRSYKVEYTLKAFLHQADEDSASGSGRPREFYGFVALVTTYILWGAYVAWALLPDKWLVAMGIEWYPNRYALYILSRRVRS